MTRTIALSSTLTSHQVYDPEGVVRLCGGRRARPQQRRAKSRLPSCLTRKKSSWPRRRRPVTSCAYSRMKPWRAALTSATASGKSTRIASRSATACSSALPETFSCPSAAPVSSTAVFSVSVANCSRCASCTVSACCSANSRKPRRRSSGSPPNGNPNPPLPSTSSPLAPGPAIVPAPRRVRSQRAAERPARDRGGGSGNERDGDVRGREPRLAALRQPLGLDDPRRERREGAEHGRPGQEQRVARHVEAGQEPEAERADEVDDERAERER